MHEFSFRNNEFYCEDIKIADIAARVGTPFYLYSYKTLIDHYKKLKTAFQSIKTPHLFFDEVQFQSCGHKGAREERGRA